METSRSFTHTEADRLHQQRRVAEVQAPGPPLHGQIMDHVNDEINELCSEDRYFRFADGKVRLGRCFWHLLGMGGLEFAVTRMCSTHDCPMCEVPNNELDKTDVLLLLLYPL